MRVRLQRIAVPLLALIACLSCPSPAISNTDPAGPPLGFTAQIVDNGPGQESWVQCAWSAPPGFDDVYFAPVYFNLQRRDDSVADPFFIVIERIQAAGARDTIRALPGPNCHVIGDGLCAQPGHTYTYRVTMDYYAAACFGGAIYDSAPSNEVTVAIPGGEGDPPTNLIAVADKQRRVELTWTPPQERPDSYRILRRPLGGPGKAPFRAGTGDGYEVVGTVDGEATSWKDRDLLHGRTDAEIYGYSLEAVREAGAAAATKENLAYLLANTKNLKSSFREPQSVFAGSGPDGIAVLAIAGDGSRKFALGAALTAEQTAGGVAFGGTLGALDGRALPRQSAATCGTAGEVALRPEWAEELKVGGPATMKLAYAKLLPFDHLAFRRLNLTLTVPVPGPRPDEKARFALEQNDENVPTVPTTRLYATAAPGKVLARDGDKVIVLYQILCLGPVPLYSKRVRLTATVSNGVILGGIGEEHFQLLGEIGGDGQGRSVALFDVGAIGPTAADRSQVASLVLQVRVASAGKDQYSETQVQFTYADGTSWEYEEDVEWDLAERTVDVRVERRKPPAKR